MAEQNDDPLALLMEEAGELITAAGKLRRFGPLSKGYPGTPTNEDALCKEIGDLLGVVDMLADEGGISIDWELINQHRATKRQRVQWIRDAFNGDRVLIWAPKHSAWWRKDARGYAEQPHQAGLYQTEVARTLIAQIDPAEGVRLETYAEAIARAERG